MAGEKVEGTTPLRMVFKVNTVEVNEAGKRIAHLSGHQVSVAAGDEDQNDVGIEDNAHIPHSKADLQLDTDAAGAMFQPGKTVLATFSETPRK